MFQEGWNSIKDKDRSSRPIIACTPEMMDSVYVLILVYRRITIEEISEQLGISVGTVHKIMHEHFAFLKSVAIRFHQDNARPHIVMENNGNHLSVWWANG